MRKINAAAGPEPRARSAGIGFTVLSAVGFGITPMLAEGILSGGMSPAALAFWRCAAVLPILFVMVLLRPGASFRVRPAQLGQIALLSLGGAVLTGLLLIGSYRYLDSGTATTLNFTYPIFVLLFGGLFCRQRVSAGDALCFAACGLGVVLLCGVGGALSLPGLAMALGSGLVYGAYVLYLEKSRVLERVSMEAYTFYYFLMGAVFLLPIAALGGGLRAASDGPLWGRILLYSMLCGFLCTFAFQLGVERIGSRAAALLSTLEPVVSLLAGALLLNETVTAVNWAGAAVILASAMLLVLGGGSKKERRQ